jgi:hypothetical protein
MKRNLKFESRIINPILRIIKNNQEYLTKPENLPQLAKLGYMYNSLWYNGRHASYENIIDANQNDDNPKYKIEMCNPKTDEIENYIYDAWGMHVSNDYGPGWEEFKTIVAGGIELSDVERKLLKPNKTFDEWVDIKTDSDYRYTALFGDRRKVADYLLCTIGTGYGYKNGYIIEEASGADQDTTDYGDWKNCTFRKDIQLNVNKIMEDVEVKKVMQFITIEKEKFEAKKLAKEIKSFGMPYKEWQKTHQADMDKLYEGMGGEVEEEKVFEYYPISEYSIITQLDENAHPSYITAALEICEHIVKHPPVIGKNWNQYQKDERIKMIKFAEKFLKKHN